MIFQIAPITCHAISAKITAEAAVAIVSIESLLFLKLINKVAGHIVTFIITFMLFFVNFEHVGNVIFLSYRKLLCNSYKIKNPPGGCPVHMPEVNDTKS